MLKIIDLHASVDGKEILKGVNLEAKPGEVHAIMGPNGAGKSTLAYVIFNHPLYEVTQGQILFKDEDISDKDPEERARLGLFLSFQYPLEIQGLSNFKFLFSAFNAQRKAKNLQSIEEKEFEVLLDEMMEEMKITKEFKSRNLNEGFSGGEKKRNEILQMRMLDPEFMVLDETDSGLDIDAMKVIAKGINQMRKPDKGQILITHYQRLLEYVRPDFVHVFCDGKIVESGDYSLAIELEKHGYSKWMEKELV